jgi:hypothetical protein
MVSVPVAVGVAADAGVPGPLQAVVASSTTAAVTATSGCVRQLVGGGVDAIAHGIVVNVVRVAVFMPAVPWLIATVSRKKRRSRTHETGVG